MKIGILTLPLHTNYGGILQAYALQTVLERMGHDVVVFQNDYIGIKKFPFWKMPILWSKRLYRKYITNRNIDIFLEQKRKREYPVLSRNTSRFVQKYIHTFHVKSLSDIPFKEFDAIVVGSDQVWRPAYFRKMWNADIQDAFLYFAKKWDIKRVAYAASFGVDDWHFSQKETIECKHLAKLFDAISVREDSGVDLCMNHLDVCAKQLLDPTMLFTKDDYIKHFGLKKSVHDSAILFSYILDETPDKKELVRRIAGEKKMIVDQISVNQVKSVPIEERIIPPVEEWLECIYNSDMVVTDSFHGCVFSIIFGKPFVAIANDGRGLSRFKSLLHMFGLQNHLLLNNNDYSHNKHYLLTDQLLNRISALQEESFAFLSNTLVGSDN